MKAKSLLLFAIVGILFAGFGIYLGQSQTNPEPASPSAVTNLLSQTMTDAEGKPQALSQWKGTPLVVNFWATWCAPCVDEMPELSALQGEVAPKQIQIIGIGIDSASNIAKFASDHKITYPLYVGGVSGTDLSRQFGNQTGGLPYTVLVDREGRVQKTYLGRLKMEELRGDLASL